jgi:hypothetical protein
MAKFDWIAENWRDLDPVDGTVTLARDAFLERSGALPDSPWLHAARAWAREQAPEVIIDILDDSRVILRRRFHPDADATGQWLQLWYRFNPNKLGTAVLADVDIAEQLDAVAKLVRDDILRRPGMMDRLEGQLETAVRKVPGRPYDRRLHVHLCRPVAWHQIAQAVDRVMRVAHATALNIVWKPRPWERRLTEQE